VKHDLHYVGEGQLACCDICGGGEGSLTDTECPGRAMSEPEQEAVHLHNWDYMNGYWFKKKKKYLAGLEPKG